MPALHLMPWFSQPLKVAGGHQGQATREQPRTKEMIQAQLGACLHGRAEEAASTWAVTESWSSSSAGATLGAVGLTGSCRGSSSLRRLTACVVSSREAPQSTEPTELEELSE